MYTFWGIFFVLTMFTYPYVYLIVSATLRKVNRNYEEVAQSQGMNMRQVFWKVNLPLLRPPGYDTMAIRIWVEASEALYHLVAPPALLIILLSAIPLRYMLRIHQ